MRKDHATDNMLPWHLTYHHLAFRKVHLLTQVTHGLKPGPHGVEQMGVVVLHKQMAGGFKS
jgi:hypothetical protein